MKQKNDSITKQHDKEDLGFLDDHIELLETVRQMIDVELEHRRMIDVELEHRRLMSDSDPHSRNSLPVYAGRKPPCRTLWPRIVSFFTGCLL